MHPIHGRRAQIAEWIQNHVDETTAQPAFISDFSTSDIKMSLMLGLLTAVQLKTLSEELCIAALIGFLVWNYNSSGCIFCPKSYKRLK